MAVVEIPRGWPGPESANGAVALLKRESVWHLAGYDGCLCARLKILAFEIEINCRKSSKSKEGETYVVTRSRHLNVSRDDCLSVAEEVARQVREQEPQARVIVVAEKE